MNTSTPDPFTKEVAERYDERNSRLRRISDCLHFLSGLILTSLPADARVLCAGVGTGAELLYLAQCFPQWRFVALDPSLAMLDVCRERVAQAGLAPRCDFVHGHVADLPDTADFDAALSILVAHFIARDKRVPYFAGMTRRLRPGGWLVNVELSFDLDSAEFPAMLQGWERVQELMGATPASLASLPTQLREMLTVVPPAEAEGYLRAAGIPLPVRFFQALMICGWYGRKDA